MVFIKKMEKNKIIRRHFQLTFDGTHKIFDDFNTYMMRRSEIEIYKPVYFEYIILELIELSIYETIYDVLETLFGQKITQLLLMDIVCFILSLNAKDIRNDLRNREDLFDFSSMNKEH